MRVDAAGSRFADVPTQNFKAVSPGPFRVRYRLTWRSFQVTFDDMKAAHGPYYDCKRKNHTFPLRKRRICVSPLHMHE